MDSTWEDRDLPVLDAIVRALDENPLTVAQVRDIATATGLDALDVWRACRAMDGVYIQLREVMAGGNPEPHRILAVSPQARAVVGQWPTPEAYIARLVAALEQRADDATDPEEKSRLRRAAEALGSLGRDVAVGVAAAALGGAVT